MAAETEKEIQQLKKRFQELAEKCYMQNGYFFTGFLGMGELDAFYQVQKQFAHVPYTVFGGNTNSERQMVRFGNEEMLGYDMAFPICCIEVKPLLEKFADALTHRDFLGACMNLGIERSTLGDILIKGKSAYIYCTETIAPYIVENLTKVKHTNVRCRIYHGEAEALVPKPVEKELQVASERLDAVVAKVYNLSREKSLLLFREKKIFVNGRGQENNSSIPKAGDVITVRGFGKFIYGGMNRTTRKGKCNIKVDVFV